MNISIVNLGPIKSAEISPADLTVICGKNNTGKTYISYVYYGCLVFLNARPLHVDESIVENLIENGSVKLPVSLTAQEIKNYLKGFEQFRKHFLPVLFSATPDHFEKSEVRLTIDPDTLQQPNKVAIIIKAGNNLNLSLTKEKGADEITVTLLIGDSFKTDKNELKIILSSILGDVLKKVYFKSEIPDITFASAERTGVLMFREELNFNRKKNLESVVNEMGKPDDDFNQLLKNMYPLPVVENIAFMKNLRTISKHISALSKRNPDLVSVFDQIAAGTFKVDESGLYYVPEDNNKVSLAMEESSSSVRSLVLLSFWIRHRAKKGELLMIDEPEMNLHPHSQRILARWIVMLVNAGVKVMLTTHSDYMIKELNILMMLHSRKSSSSIRKLMDEEGVLDSMLLSPKKIRVYVTSRENRKGKILSSTQVSEAPVDKMYGVAVTSFDDTINKMNNLQEAIIFHGS